MGNKSISVIIPVYNGEKYLKDAIESVIFQSLPPSEIIIIDDGSSDGTAKIVASYGDRLKYVYQENCGIPASRNRGVKMATGDYITFLDHDDRFLEQTLEIQYGVFQKYQTAEIVFGHAYLAYPGKSESDVNSKELKKILQILLGCTMMKRSVFDRVGFFDESMLMAEDIDLFLRTKEAGIPMAIHEDVVLYYQKHETNITNNKIRSRLFYMRAIHKAKKRREHITAEYSQELITDIQDAKELWHTAR